MSNDRTHPATYSVRFEPAGRTVTVASGASVFTAATQAGLAIQNTCGGDGTCMQCRVSVRRGKAPPDDAALTFLSHEELAAGYILACRTPVHDNLEIFVPPPFQS